MALRSKEAAAIFAGLAISVFGADVRVDVQRDLFRGAAQGTLTATDTELRYEESTGRKPNEHSWSIAWPDIQQLWISPDKIRVLTYEDRKLRFGADREYELTAAPGWSFTALHDALKGKLDQRMISAVPESRGVELWRKGAKLREKFGGPEGTLIAATDGMVFASKDKGKSRTWRLRDIDNISSSGPFEFTITTFERSGFADRKMFHFQLKEALPESRYNELWRRLQEARRSE